MNLRRLRALVCISTAAAVGGCAQTQVDPGGAESSSSSTGTPVPGSSSDDDDSTTIAVDGSSSGAATSSGSVDGSTDDTGPPPVDEGCPECILLADGLAGGRGIALDATHVYFTDQSEGTVARVAKDGGELELLASGRTAPYDLAIADGFVYWSENGDVGVIARVAAGGGGVEVVDADTENARGIAVDAAHVYWTTFTAQQGALWRKDLAGAGERQLLLSGVAGFADLVLDADSVYVTSHDPDPVVGVGFIQPPPEDLAVGSIVAVPKLVDPEAPGGEVLVGSVAQPWGIALGGGALFWANGDGLTSNDANAVLTRSLGAAAASVVVEGQTAPWGVAADDTAVFWTDNDSVKSVAHVGGRANVLATQQASARSIAVDEANVYWITQNRVLQRAKP